MSKNLNNKKKSRNSDITFPVLKVVLCSLILSFSTIYSSIFDKPDWIAQSAIVLNVDDASLSVQENYKISIRYKTPEGFIVASDYRSRKPNFHSGESINIKYNSNNTHEFIIAPSQKEIDISYAILLLNIIAFSMALIYFIVVFLRKKTVKRL